VNLWRSDRAGLKARRGAIHWVRQATRVAAASLAGVPTIQIGKETKAQTFTLAADNIAVRSPGS